MAEVHPGIDFPGGRAARNVIRDDALLDDVPLFSADDSDWKGNDLQFTQSASG